MFLEPFPKGPCKFPYVLLITLQSVTLVPVDYSSSLCGVVAVLGSNQEALDGVPSLEMDLDSLFARNVLEAFTITLGVGYHHMDVVVVAIVVVFGLVDAMFMVDGDLEYT